MKDPIDIKTQELLPERRYFAYLRVSTTDQENSNQRLGILDYANARGFAPVIFVEDTVSGIKSWRKRALGNILAQAAPGDVILTPEISRIGRSLFQIVEFIKEAREKQVDIHITRDRMILDDSITADTYAFAFGLVAQIERKLISDRTKEGLRRTKLEGTVLGRPTGSLGRLKLEGRELEVAGYLKLGLSEARIAHEMGCTPKTLALFIKRRKVRELMTAIQSTTLLVNKEK